MPELNERDLLLRVKQNDADAFKTLYIKYAPRVFNFSLKLILQKEEAGDIVQQVFLAIWEQRSGLQEDKSFESYVFSIARHLLYQAFRKHILRTEAYEYMHKHHDHSADQTMEEVLFQEVQTVLLDLIEKLPEKRREIFRLHRLDGLSYHEIAQRLCISENTVDTQMRKSLQFIRNEFEKHHG